MGKHSLETAGVSRRPTRPELLLRERLFGLLDELRKHPVLWIGGPPGAGKTALVASYLERRQLHGIWYHLGSEDRDAEVLFAQPRLADSGQVAPRRQNPARSGPEGPYPVGLGRQALRTFHHRLPNSAVLVLDDCHEVPGDAPLHALIAEAVGEMPQGQRLVLIGRGEPPTAYARLIANRMLAVLDPRELQLTRDETRAIAGRVSADEVWSDTLHRECGGWAAGVAIALERLRRTSAQPQDLKGEIRRALFDYFAGEAFDRFPQEERRALVATALLPSLSARMAEEVSGSPRAPVLLQRLASRQCFISRTVGDATTYEYLPLFREFLLSRIEETLAPVQFERSASVAAAVLERGGELEASMTLRAKIRDWEAMLRLLSSHGMTMLGRGQVKTVRKWVGAFPAEVAAQSPWVTYWSAAAVLAESPVAARALLSRAWAAFAENSDRVGQTVTAATMLETYQCEWSTYTGAHVWLDRLATCLESNPTLPSTELELRVLANLVFALTNLRTAPGRAAPCVARLHALLEADLDVNQRLLAARILIAAGCARADTDGARELAARMRSMLEEPGCAPATRAAALSAIAQSLWLEGSFAEAHAALEQATQAAAKDALTTTDVLHHLTRQLVAVGRRDSAELANCIQALRRLIDPSCHLGMAMFAFALAQQAQLRGERAAALNQWVAAAARAEQAGVRPLQRTTKLALAAAFAAQGESAEASRVLNEAQALLEGETAEHAHREHELLTAYLALHRAERAECHRLLGQSLAGAPLASQAFALFPGQMAELCLEALQAGIEPDCARELIRQYRLPPPAHADGAWPWPFKVSLLGRFRLLKNDAPIRFSRRTQRKPLELLQALVAFGGVEVGTGVLTDALWPESEGDAGYHALESALYRLRQLLGVPAAVTMTGGKLTLDPQQFWVDVWALESELRQIPSDATRAAERLPRLRQLYTGHFLEHESERPWALKRRQMLRERYVRAIREVARSYESRRLWQEAVNVYQMGIEVDTLAEDFHRGLIVCYRELGDHGAAVQAYRRCSELLVKMLGVQPNAKTLAIYRSVRLEAAAPPG